MTAPDLPELLRWPAHELSQAIHARRVGCREVMQATLAHIGRVNPLHQAIVSLRGEAELLDQANHCDTLLARGEPMGWMHGMPQAIKDLSHAAGLPTTMGSPLLRDFVPSHDGLMAARMKTAGAIVIGKTNTPEFGLGSHTYNTVFGTTRNAYDPDKSAGGSSGGAAVALALRMLPVADGSDFMGSLRNPAAWNNLFGLRPSQGRVPMVPSPDVWLHQLGTEGPMARTVRDLALLLGTQAGHDPSAPLSIALKQDFMPAPGAFDAKTCRIGWFGDLQGYLPMEPGIMDTCEQGLLRMQGMGCGVEPLAASALGLSPHAVWQTWLVWRKALTASRIAPLVQQAQGRAQIKPEALWEYDQATHLSGAELLQASAQRSQLYQHLRGLLERFDALALPCTQVWPFDARQHWPTEINGRAMDTYHRWMEVVIYATLAGLPCISVPVGFRQGLPCGMQLIGKPQGEAALLQLASAYETAAQDLLQITPSQIAR